MADTTEQLKELNQNATLLLQKYDGVFSKLDKESQKILVAMASKSEEGLNAITELLESGNVAQAENALKLGGKSLEEVLENSTNGVLQAIAYHDYLNTTISVSDKTYTDTGLEITITPKKVGSKLYCNATGMFCINEANAGFRIALYANDVLVNTNSDNWAFFAWNRDEGYNIEASRFGLITTTSLDPITIKLKFSAYDNEQTDFLENYHHSISVMEVS